MCLVEYDYIAKVETFSSDPEYILDLFGAAEILHRKKRLVKAMQYQLYRNY